jgi:hypothetical protein
MQATLQTITPNPNVRIAAKRLVRCVECSQFLELPPDLSIDHSLCPCCHASLANSVLCSVHLDREQPSGTFGAPVAPTPPPPSPATPLSNHVTNATKVGSSAPEHFVGHGNHPKPKGVVLVWSLGALAVGLLVAIAMVFSLMPTKTASTQTSDSKELIEMFKNDVEQLQAKTEDARLQLEQQRVRNAQLEKERTRLQMEVNKLAEANTF